MEFEKDEDEDEKEERDVALYKWCPLLRQWYFHPLLPHAALRPNESFHWSLSDGKWKIKVGPNWSATAVFIQLKKRIFEESTLEGGLLAQLKYMDEHSSDSRWGTNC